MARYLGGASVAELCDGPLRAAMHALGELWHHEQEGVFIEHRATDLALQAIAHLRGTFEPPESAPVALGATPEDDPYILPSFMAAAVVAAAGLRAVNLGPDTPVSALRHAIAHHRPRLVWISASATLPPARARELATLMANLPAPTIGVVGGRQRGAIAAAYPGVRVVVSMAELAQIAQQLAPAPIEA
jgi:methanogenic corrinoid protein MtbC1